MTSIVYLQDLPSEEKDLVLNAPAIVTLLIGGVDDNLSDREEAMAKKVVHFRTVTGDPILFDYFKLIDPEFIPKLEALERKYHDLQPEVRTKILVEELEKLNDILPGLDNLFARALLRSWRSLAKEVAQATGGILGVLRTTYEEEHLIGLEMITVNP